MTIKAFSISAGLVGGLYLLDRLFSQPSSSARKNPSPSLMQPSYDPAALSRRPDVRAYVRAARFKIPHDSYEKISRDLMRDLQVKLSPTTIRFIAFQEGEAEAEQKRPAQIPFFEKRYIIDFIFKRIEEGFEGGPIDGPTLQYLLKKDLGVEMSLSTLYGLYHKARAVQSAENILSRRKDIQDFILAARRKPMPDSPAKISRDILTEFKIEMPKEAITPFLAQHGLGYQLFDSES